MKVCEVCSKEIDNYWGYLSDFYPNHFPPRDRSQNQTLYGVQYNNPATDVMEFHYFCSEEHATLYQGGIRDADSS